MGLRVEPLHDGAVKSKTYEGGGYTITDTRCEEGAHTVVLEPGAVYVYSGSALIDGQHTVVAGQGAEIVRRVEALLGPKTRIIAGSPVEDAEPDAEVDTAAVVVRPLQVHHKPWGYEVEVETSAKKIQLKRLHIREGQMTSLQYHNEKDEIMLEAGDGSVQYVSPGTTHRRTGPADYFEVSTYHPEDVVRLHDMYGREGTSKA